MFLFKCHSVEISTKYDSYKEKTEIQTVNTLCRGQGFANQHEATEQDLRNAGIVVEGEGGKENVPEVGVLSRQPNFI